ncbi:MAG TPA: hypothetical protein VMR97_07965 [Acidimicrobiales bacterium]|nr:hypothetical protein [Acidimicrobiales bacterium]
MDTPVRRGDQGQPVELRIIGIELRLRDHFGQEEIALVPCDVRIPAGHPHMLREINATIHTSLGDTNFPINAQLPGG